MICLKCREDKDETEFHRSANKRGRHHWCKSCRKGYDADRNVDNRETIAAQKRALRNRNRAFVYEYLSTKKCSDCPESDPVVLEFHHRRDKSFNVGDLIQLRVSLEKLSKEIEKCDVLCANCHRRRTARERGHYKFLRGVAQK